MKVFSGLALESGLLFLGDSRAKLRDRIENQLVTPNQTYVYLAVASARWEVVELTIADRLDEIASTGLTKVWAGLIKTPSQALVLDEVAMDMARREMWRYEGGTDVPVAVYADLPKDSTRVALLIPATEMLSAQEPAGSESAPDIPEPPATTRPVLLDVTRTFYWGGLEIIDAESGLVPIADGEPFTTNSEGVRVDVLHEDDPPLGQDGPARVHVRVLEGPADLPPSFACRIPTGSGLLSIGDANREDIIEVENSVIRMEILTIPVSEACEVLVWIT